jgi:hypothetical protein
MIRDLLKILRWKETWIIYAAALVVVGFWFLYAYLLTVPFPIGAVVIWGLLIGLSILAPQR